jgi:hypothetical protein
MVPGKVSPALSIKFFGAISCAALCSARPTRRQNPMPGKAGGFNNDEINGKSRNPDSTTPGTGPANLQQYGSADVHMTAVRGLDEESRHEH